VNRVFSSILLRNFQSVDQGDVKSVVIQNTEIEGVTKDSKKFVTYLPMNDQLLLGELIKKMLA